MSVKYERDVTFYVDADTKEDVEEFLDAQDSEWRPGEVPGLIDVVSDEEEVGYELDEEKTVTANFEILAGKLMEKGS